MRRSEGEELLCWELQSAKIEYRRQARITMARRWTADFYLPESGFYVEVEGGAYSGGHKRGAAADTDTEKSNWCVMNGLCVLRFTTAQVRDGTAIVTIKEAIG